MATQMTGECHFGLHQHCPKASHYVIGNSGPGYLSAIEMNLPCQCSCHEENKPVPPADKPVDKDGATRFSVSFDGVMDRLEELERENHHLRAFRAKVLAAFKQHNLSCDCTGVTHESGCPLGELEVEALADSN